MSGKLIKKIKDIPRKSVLIISGLFLFFLFSIFSFFIPAFNFNNNQSQISNKTVATFSPSLELEPVQMDNLKKIVQPFVAEAAEYRNNLYTLRRSFSKSDKFSSSKAIKGNIDSSLVKFTTKGINIQYALSDIQIPKIVQKNNVLTYQNIQPNIDVRYTSYVDYLKEDIVLKSNKSPRRFVFNFQSDQVLEYKLDNKGGVIASSGKTPIFYLQPLTANDANGKVLKFDYELAIGDNVQTIVVKSNNDAQFKDVKYPIIIDPTTSFLFTPSSSGSAAYHGSLATTSTITFATSSNFVSADYAAATTDDSDYASTTATSTSNLYVDDVFSTYTYTGNAATQSINNGIDLAGEGGLVWAKARGLAYKHVLADTVRSISQSLSTDSTAAQTNDSGVTSWASNGFTMNSNGYWNTVSEQYVSWTFRKAPKFFDVVTYTGSGENGQMVPHNLGSVPGMIIIKSTTSASAWYVYHRSLSTNGHLKLNRSDAVSFDTNYEIGKTVSDTHFYVDTGSEVDASGQTYIAYLFAHDPNEDGIIQCGSFTADGSGNATVPLGWEPQYIITKGANTTGSWYISDSTRGLTVGTPGVSLGADSTSAESVGNDYTIPTASGFSRIANNSDYSGFNYIYLAIRRPNKPATSGTQVYNAIAFSGGGAPGSRTGIGFSPDMLSVRDRSGASGAIFGASRILGQGSLSSANTSAFDNTDTNVLTFNQDGYSWGSPAGLSTNTSGINHFFRRSPGVFDMVAYDGSTPSQQIKHNLGVVPELIIVKSRLNANTWTVYFGNNTEYLFLNQTAAKQTSATYWNSTSPTASVFSVGDDSNTNYTGHKFVSYLFATKPGISKVGSYTGNGSSQTINAGFTGGARYIMIKRTDSTGDWIVWDTVRGIVDGNDPHISLNSTVAEVTTDDSVDPDNSGFIVNQNATTDINVTNATYVYLAFSGDAITPPATDFNASHVYTFDTSAYTNQSQIQVSLTAYGVASANGVSAKIWNVASSTWDALADLSNSSSGMPSASSTHTISTDVGNYFDSDKKVKIMVYTTNQSSVSTSSVLYVDKIDLTIWADFDTADVPTNFINTYINSNSAKFEWTDNSDETYYNLERSLTSGGGFEVVATTSQNAITVTDASLSSSTTYYYRLKAMNEQGSAGYADEVIVQTASASLVPSVAGYSTLTSSSSSVLGDYYGSLFGASDLVDVTSDDADYASTTADNIMGETYVDDVFSTYTYTGNGGAQTINNGIDLAGEGGMVWGKSRSHITDGHILADTVRGIQYQLKMETTGAQTDATTAAMLQSVNSTGYAMGATSYMNDNTKTYVSWTFRKAPKFFDVVTYTGNSATRTINHGLGVAPGLIIIKETGGTGDWFVYHRSVGAANYMLLNQTSASQAGSHLAGTEPTSTEFTLGSGAYNNSGDTYVAYIFAHDPSADGIIQCGSYAGNGDATNGVSITLGWEPQWIIVRSATDVRNWNIVDNMRGLTGSYTGIKELYPNLSSAENSGADVNVLGIHATGFNPRATYNYNTNGSTYIYCAIRRPNKPATSGTQVYNAIARTGTGAAATVSGVGFAPDLIISKDRNNQSNRSLWDRLRGPSRNFYTNTAGAEFTGTAFVTAFGMDGINVGTDAIDLINYSDIPYINHFFRRAPGVFDEVAYTGTGSIRTVAHNLGVVPELMIVKNRNNSSGRNWMVYHKDVGANQEFFLNLDSFPVIDTTYFNNVAPTTSVFTVGTANATNQSSDSFASYLFATKPGISKVGSYTGNGSSQTINAGFTGGARYIMIKRTDSTGDWIVWDTVRGIVAGNDPHISLNTTAAEVTIDDSIDPDNSGFIVNQNATTNINVNNATYIYLAMSGDTINEPNYSSTYASQVYEFNTRSYANITKLNVDLLAYGTASLGDGINAKIWNQYSNNWEVLDSLSNVSTNMPSATSSQAIISNVSNFIDGMGKIRILIQTVNPSDVGTSAILYTDYINLSVWGDEQLSPPPFTTSGSIKINGSVRFGE